MIRLSMTPLVGVARGVAAFLGGFTLLNLVGEYRVANFNANEWWIDVRVIPAPAANLFLAVAAGLLIGFAAGLGRFKTFRLPLQLALALLIAITAGNAVLFWIVAFRGGIHAGFLIPLSAFLAAALTFIVLCSGDTPATGRSVSGAPRMSSTTSAASWRIA